MNGKAVKWSTEKGGRPDRPLFVPNRQRRLREQVREVMRFFHY